MKAYFAMLCSATLLASCSINALLVAVYRETSFVSRQTEHRWRHRVYPHVKQGLLNIPYFWTLSLPQYTLFWCNFQVPKCAKFKNFSGLHFGPHWGSLQCPLSKTPPLLSALEAVNISNSAVSIPTFYSMAPCRKLRSKCRNIKQRQDRGREVEDEARNRQICSRPRWGLDNKNNDLRRLKAKKLPWGLHHWSSEMMICACWLFLMSTVGAVP